MKKALAVILAAGLGMSAFAAAEVIKLPPPSLGTCSLKQALEKRKTNRVFSPRALSAQELANLLWVANGVNRADGKLTIPGAQAKYAIILYVATADGVYKHNRTAAALEKVADGDVRKLCDSRGLGVKAPAVIISVVNDKVFGTKTRGREYAAIEAGAIMQDLYLYCAAAELNTVVCGSFKKELAAALKLSGDEHIILTQIVGYPELKK